MNDEALTNWNVPCKVREVEGENTMGEIDLISLFTVHAIELLLLGIEWRSYHFFCKLIFENRDKNIEKGSE